MMACRQQTQVVRRWGRQAFAHKTGQLPSLETPTNKFLVDVLSAVDPKAARRLAMCGSRLPLRCTSCERPTSVVFRCNLRICPTCARVRSEKLRAAWRLVMRSLLAARLVDGSRLRLVTVTLRTTGNVRERVYRIKKAFDVFWRRTWARERGSGAIVAVEVGANQNVHIHALVHGSYRSQKSLSRIWMEITGDSYVVDIRRVRGVDRAVSEVVKYVTKGVSAEGDPYYLAVVHMAFKGARRLSTKGVFYGVKLSLDDNIRCGLCGGRVRVDFPLTPAHEEGIEPFRYFEVRFVLPYDSS